SEDSQGESLTFLDSLSRELMHWEYSLAKADWHSDIFSDDVIYVVLDDGVKGLLVDPNPARFEQITKLTMVTGFARTAHAEYEKLTLVTLDVQQRLDPGTNKLLKPIANILRRSFGGGVKRHNQEREHLYIKDQLMIPRVLQYHRLSKHLNKGKEPTILVQRAYGEKNFPGKLSVQQDISCHPVFAHDDLPKKPIQPDEIEIDVRAHGVNRGHTWKRVADGLLLGECAGIVTKLGSAIGGFDGAPFASKVRVGNIDNSFASRLPPTMPFTTAACLPTAFFAPIEFTHHKVSALGKTFLRVHKCPFGTVYQLVIQLACRLYYGHNPPSWETISVARFHNGRVDWIQAVSPVVNEFCTAAADPNVRLAEQRRLFFAAANAHVNAMTLIARGQGFKAHLHALHGVLTDNEDLPLLFMDPSWEQTRVQSTKIVKTD
ncbi:MAG: hypothetical protein Q9164_006970, partial [Protoblastenia rupestris]